MVAFNNEIQNNLRNHVGNILRNSKNSIKISNENKIILDLHETASCFVRKHKKDIMITKADKGNVTVILNKSKYISKASKILSEKILM